MFLERRIVQPFQRTDIMRKIAMTAFAALALAGPAQAATETVSVAVMTEDLDLTRAAGQKVLAGRIEAAAEKVCGTPFIRDLKAMDSWASCKAAAIADARAAVPALTLAMADTPSR
jgi:UrcA family protein